MRKKKTEKLSLKKRIWKWTKRLVVVMLVPVIIGVLVVGSAFLGLWGRFDVEDYMQGNFSAQLFYTDQNGNIQPLDNLFYGQNRVWADLSEIPLHMRHAAIAIEDRRFESHRGVDLRRTSGAMLNFVFRFDDQFGGSTITQQLVKNLTRDDATTPWRKLREISRAVNVERRLSKDEIMELYLNEIYLANGAIGVQAAALTYFDVDVSELTIAQSAAIVGITQHPVRFDPFRNPENNRERQLLVLAEMLDSGFITAAEHQAAVAEELVFTRGAAGGGMQTYFIDQVVEDVLHALIHEEGYSHSMASRILFSGGLRIYTTFNPEIQAAIDRIYTNPANFPREGAQSAMAIINPTNGHVVGLAGGIGRTEARRTLNRATQSLRQPGSSIKPISSFAPALERNLIAPGTVFVDEPRTFGGWTPRNADHSFRGPVTVDAALRASLNTIPVQIVHQMGVDRSFEFMTENLGITSLVYGERRADGGTHSDRNLAAMALGGLTDGVSVLEMAAAYVPFANGGMYMRPTTFTLVTDMDGNEILRRDVEERRAMSEVTAFMMAQMLRGAITAGTGGGAGVPNQFTAGKTGTTDNNHDRWFVGFTTHYVAAVWYGFDIPQNLGRMANPCIPVFRNVMTEIHQGLPSVTSIRRPAGIASISTCMDSGLIPSDLCALDVRGSRVVTSYFQSGRGPGGTCERHVEIMIDYVTGMRATPFCPPDNVQRASTINDESDALYNTPCTYHDWLTPAGPGNESGTGNGTDTGSGSGTTIPPVTDPGTGTGTGTPPAQQPPTPPDTPANDPPIETIVLD
ncbi:MAG: transglycosylase domain-containing protein [Oscillospiraceae bacterium]|nr:transglycosylase domain-containing protein [Oscillospiraceae bacterium]